MLLELDVAMRKTEGLVTILVAFGNIGLSVLVLGPVSKGGLLLSEIGVSFEKYI